MYFYFEIKNVVLRLCIFTDNGLKEIMEHLRITPAVGPTQSPIQWVPGALSWGVKWPGREADHSPPSSAEVKNE
jgi:hypothetical protein